MLNSSFDNGFTSFDLGSNIRLIDPNIENLPPEIKSSQQFCLWKYEVKNDTKPAKKPYGYLKEHRRVIPSLKNKDYWFNFSEFLKFKNLFHDFNLGLVLIDGPFTVIDIDNYQYYVPLDRLLLSMLKKGAYIEVSPSGKGLHIFFMGQWSHKKNKGDKQIVVEGSNIKTSCEIYSGKDVRFITLTGCKLFYLSDISVPLTNSTNICEELIALENIFFNSLQELDSNFSTFVSPRNQSIEDNILSQDDLEFHFSRIKKNILDSDYFREFIDLCSNINHGYKSASEADWHFCLIVSNFINPKWPYRDQIKIFEYIFVNARKNRDKNNRTDYLKRTIQKVLIARNELNKTNYSSDKYNNIESFTQKRLDVSITNVTKKRKSEANKNAIIKICNIMKIFHLGRSVKNFEYCNDSEGNYLKATIPNSLNYIDLKYYMQLLFQYLDMVNQLPDIKLAQSEFLPININLILKSLNSSTGGKSYNQFKASLNKLSDVTLIYNKKITLDGLHHAQKESLLSYKILYQHSRKGSTSNYSTKWRKLAIKMHPIILDISKEATYNYSLFNKNSYKNLDSDKMKLLYYHACCLTFPGGNPVQLSLEDLLSLWPPTNLRQVTKGRKKEMIQLLQDFASLQSNLDDLDISLIYINGKIVGVKIKKRKLKLV